METLEMEDMGGQHQTLLCQGPVELTSGKKRKKRHLSLFNDVLVVSGNLNKKWFKIKCIIPLNFLWVVDNVAPFRKNEMCTCKTLFLLWPNGKFWATFCSKEQKDWWCYFLRRSVNKAKKGIKKTFSLQILTEDILTCDSPLCVTATKTNTVNDIIDKLLPMIRMPNSEDYQLWFCPDHEEAPRALQGCENPHDIIMANLQNTCNRSKSKIFTAFPALPGLFVKDLNSDAQGQFILKPRDSARSQQQNAKEGRGKKQRLFLTSCFHRGSVPQEEQVCTGPTLNRGKLFGQDLTSLCENGKWPTALLDILSQIREKGPTTQGIFMTPPNETSWKSLKEQFDSGEEVDIKKHSVHEVASILKEFLQMIKGSLLTSKLYDQWLAVPELFNDKEKLTAVQSLLEKLPGPNAALLGQLFRILHKIASNSSVNQMPLYNLSAGIAPYILWLPSYCNKVLENNIAKKIALVTFMIENSPKLFGEDLVLVWYETSLFHPPEAKPSCSQNTPSNTGNIKETEHGLSSCPSGRTCTPGHYALPIEEKECNVYTTQQAPSETPPAPVKNQVFNKFPPIVCLERMLPSPMLDMLSVIAEKGQDSDQIFRFLPEKSHWPLRDRIYTEQPINWNEESVLTVASVLMDFIRNIQGSLLSSDLYENWLSVPDEKSLPRKISAIQSILLKMPQPNYFLLKQLIHVLLKVKTSTRNHLDTFILSIRIAPHMLWDLTCRNSLSRNDLEKKMSIIQITIDNCVDIFGEDISFGMIIKRSDDIKTSVNSAGGDLYQEYLIFSI
ncbi:rho GTPase-activating protein 20-like isoform X3 [Mastomys coucha]|uniref:rho GTPase-activating protein 20-like isoform X3 n=1 Tax=Mastomys coucha TaxID=35658 RepID=UPI001261FB5B|nr:rho GTPase-activating protein 20-like isoform X3 [Mastomys coucha]